MKYGMEGYGLYWYCLELIAQNVEKHNLSFELEHDSEIIAHDTGIHYELVQDMMGDMVDLGLFERSEGIITCLKMASRTDEYTQKLIRTSGVVPTISRQCPDKVPPNRIEQNRIEQNRIEQNRTEQNRTEKTTTRFAPPSLPDVLEYKLKRQSPVDPNQFIDYYESNGWRVGKNKMKCWKACFRNWEKREGKQNVQYQTANEKAAERMRHTFDIDTATEF